MHQSIDLIPIPKCFSHLVKNADGEPRSLNKLSVVQENNDLSSLLNDGDSNEGPDFGTNSQNERLISVMAKMHGVRTVLDEVSDIPQIDQHDSVIDPSPHTLHSNRNFSLDRSFTETDDSGITGMKIPKESTYNHQPTAFELSDSSSSLNHIKSPFHRLNSSLQKLQREMKDLRHLDDSLFCQLVSLHEAIQDFKLSVSDRYSETGSEYSLGTASYMGSMSSLNDDSDWAEDGTMLNSPHGLDRHESAEPEGDENGAPSATSLLQQITDLALRADQDF